MKFNLFFLLLPVLLVLSMNEILSQFSSVQQSLSHVQLFNTPWTVAHQASLLCQRTCSMFSTAVYFLFLKIGKPWDFPGSSVVKFLCFHHRGHEFNP